MKHSGPSYAFALPFSEVRKGLVCTGLHKGTETQPQIDPQHRNLIDPGVCPANALRRLCQESTELIKGQVGVALWMSPVVLTSPLIHQKKNAASGAVIAHVLAAQLILSRSMS